jgi:hypothetical protein
MVVLLLVSVGVAAGRDVPPVRRGARHKPWVVPNITWPNAFPFFAACMASTSANRSASDPRKTREV